MVLNIWYQIDDHTTFQFGKKNGFSGAIYVKINGVRELKKKKICKKNNNLNIKLQIYTKEDMIKYYSVDRGEFKLDEDKKFILDTKRELIFIPLVNINQNIIAYAITCLKDYDKIKGMSFHADSKRKYALNKFGFMHGTIFGRKPDPGGWRKIENYVETEGSLSATWITSDEMPPIHIGKNLYYCRDKCGNVYIKMPPCAIDHSNGDALDNRITNLREVSCGLNAANKRKLKGKTSKYFGVHRMNNKWVSNIIFNRVHYQRRFDVEQEAAKFHDMYSLALYRMVICNNGFLTEQETKDILENGEAAIPEEYRVTRQKDRILPKYIMMDKDTFKVCKVFNGRQYAERFSTLEEAIDSLPRLHAAVNNAKEEYKAYFLKTQLHNLHDTYGILHAYDKNGIVRAKAIVDREIWLKYIHINWTVSSNRRLSGKIDGITSEIHVHVFREYYPDYHRIPHGTVDHTTPDKDNVSDCRRVNLRPATFSQQSQNTETKSILPYKGVGMAYGKFFAILGWEGEIYYGERREFIEDAARDYNKLVLEKWKDAKLNVVPDTQTTMEYFYHKEILTLEQINDFTTRGEIASVFYTNPDWALMCGVDIKNIKRKELEKYKKMLKYLLQYGEIMEDDIDDDCDDEEESEGVLIKDEEELVKDEGEGEEIKTTDDKKLHKRRKYMDIPLDPETDASRVNNLCYGYTKQFDRTKITIDEKEAEIIRIIFAESSKKQSTIKIATTLNDLGYKKNRREWTHSIVRSVLEFKDRYEGGIVEGRRCRHPRIL